VSATFETKSPAPVLLVDDDRWYDQQQVYRRAMEETGLGYDVWETSLVRGGHRPGPSTEMLGWYPVVVWWTGYDWYAPVTREEERALKAYLDGGGRLMLSSQDFLYYHHDDAFAQGYLGVLTYTEDITPTHVQGPEENPVGGGLGPWPLEYPRGYQNWSDGVTPARDVGVAFRDQGDRGAALTRRAGTGATIFFAFPLESLPPEGQTVTMGRAVGWLSWLGRSTFAVEPRSALPGDPVTYTLILQNDGLEKITASLSNTVPPGLEVTSAPILGPGAYDPVERRLSWQGVVTAGQTMTFSYRARVVSGTHDAIDNVAGVLLEDHEIPLERGARLRVGGAELSPSTFDCRPTVLRPGGRTTCTLTLHNAGTADIERATARIYPPGVRASAGDAVWTSEGIGRWEGDVIIWSGPLVANGTATLTFLVRASVAPVESVTYGIAFLDDGRGGTWERPTWLVVDPWQIHLPWITRFDHRMKGEALRSLSEDQIVQISVEHRGVRPQAR
jgi:uncharacterized repeat protein (TIGR01451 family)